MKRQTAEPSDSAYGRLHPDMAYIVLGVGAVFAVALAIGKLIGHIERKIRKKKERKRVGIENP